MNTNGYSVRLELSSGRGLLLSLYGFVYECPGLVAGFGGVAGCDERFPAASGTKLEEGKGAAHQGVAFWSGSGVNRRGLNHRSV